MLKIEGLRIVQKILHGNVTVGDNKLEWVMIALAKPKLKSNRTWPNLYFGFDLGLISR